ncbi:MAG: transporter substrate-binding domain-containing protein [Chromatiales bacterium]|nr:transporter substrate-binding domain-containing protein [Gammaproteobacteria bacterium]
MTKESCRMVFSSFKFIALLVMLLLSLSAVGGSVPLSVQEKAWLDQQVQVRVGLIDGMAPISIYKQNRQPSGIAADYLRFVSRKMGLELKLVPFEDRSALDAAMMAGELDVSAVDGWTPERAEFLLFTRPYINLPGAVYASGRMPQLTLQELPGKRVAVVELSVWQDWLMRELPDTTLVKVSGVAGGLLSVAMGDADAYLGDTATARHQLTQGAATGVMEVAQAGRSRDLSFAVGKDNQMLVNILQKGLDRISPEEQLEIRKRWQVLDQPPLLQNSSVVVILLILLALLWIGVWIWAFRRLVDRKVARRIAGLKRSLHRRRRVERELKEDRERLRLRLAQVERDSGMAQNHLSLLGLSVLFGGWEWDVRRERLRWDDNLQRVFGFRPGSFDGTFDAYLGRIHVDDREAVVAAFKKALQGGADFRIEYRIVKPDGEVVWLVDSARFVRNSGGSGARLLGVARVREGRDDQGMLASTSSTATSEEKPIQGFAYKGL